jgi:hypothetical protein
MSSSAQSVVTVRLVDGQVQTLASTLQGLQLPPADATTGTVFYGRSKTGFSAVLLYLRGESDQTSLLARHLEDFVLLRLVKGGPPQQIAAVNVGGTVFHARVAVLRRSGYFRSMLVWPCADADADADACDRTEGASPLDLSGTFIDRSPEGFASMLRALEDPSEYMCPYQASFFSVDMTPGTCPSCRQRPWASIVPEGAAPAGRDSLPSTVCVRGHAACDECGREGVCPICLHGWAPRDTAPLQVVMSADRLTPPLSCPSWSAEAMAGARAALEHKSTLFEFINDPDARSPFTAQPLAKVPPFAFSYLTSEMMEVTKGTYLALKCADEYTAYTVRMPPRLMLVGDLYITVDIEGDVSAAAAYDVFGAFVWSCGGSILDTYSGNALRVLCNGGPPAFELEFDSAVTRIVCPLMFDRDLADWGALRMDRYLPELFWSRLDYAVYVSKEFRCRRAVLTYKVVELPAAAAAAVTSLRIERALSQHKELHESFVVSAPEGGIHSWHLRDHLRNVCSILVLHLTPAVTSGPLRTGPLRSLTLRLNGLAVCHLDHHLSRKILPRQLLGIADNKELMYYIPLDHTVDFCKVDNVRLDLDLAQGSYTVLLVAKTLNLLRVMSGLIGTSHYR